MKSINKLTLQQQGLATVRAGRVSVEEIFKGLYSSVCLSGHRNFNSVTADVKNEMQPQSAVFIWCL
jgi:hypothetical protein